MTDCTSSGFLGALNEFQARGRRIDIVTIVHGKADLIVFKDRLFKKQEIVDLAYATSKSGQRVKYNLGAVFQVNCEGSGLNDAWLKAGAKVVAGTRKGNDRPSAYNRFFEAYVDDA